MVLLAAAICTKSGKALLSRQFVEMSKSRIEGLLSAFPKLMSGGKQHTFVETESVRYVYQPIEKLYMLLITTKASNILEDLETLRLFSRVIADYCISLEESEIMDQSFTLIFAFDEIVALGYRESVNLAQIRTFVEMDSHEEKVYQAVRQTQEREARNKMREKAKELQRQRMEAQKRGIKSPSGYMGGVGSSSNYMSAPISVDNTPTEYTKPSYSSAPSKPIAPSKALRLGTKSRDVETFVDQLKSEGEKVASTTTKIISPTAPAGKAPASTIQTEPVHLRIEEKMTVTAGRDGGLREGFEVQGIVTLRIEKEEFGKITVQLNNEETGRGIQMQTHPNVDKELFRTKAIIGLKNPAKPFPLFTDVGVLKWRFQTNDEAYLPLTINCWPSENTQGGCDVNIEYELQEDDFELRDVQINIPMPMSASPVVEECDGEYNWENRKGLLAWKLPLIDSTNKTGTLEFSTTGTTPNDFFPVSVAFVSRKPFVQLQVSGVSSVEDEGPVKFSTETVFFTEKYEIV